MSVDTDTPWLARDTQGRPLRPHGRIGAAVIPEVSISVAERGRGARRIMGVRDF